MIAQALLTHTKIKTMGLCNVPINMISSVKQKLGLENAEVEYVVLNHLTWITSIKLNGKDYLQEAIEQGINSEAMKNIPASGFTPELIKTVGAIPSSYLEYYYYRDAKLEYALKQEKSRGEVCLEIEEELLKIYEDSKLHTKPALLSKRGGARYSEAAINLVDSIYNDKRDIQVVNILNQGAIDFMRDDDVVEISAIIGKDGATPIKANFKNEHIKEYMLLMKAYERHAVQAAITGDDDEAMRALLINPLVLDYKKAYPCYLELKEAHKQYLPQFFKEDK